MTDGTSNTVAFAEKLCGQNGMNYYGSGTTPGTTYRGNMVVIGSAAPNGAYQVNAFNDPKDVINALQVCSRVPAPQTKGAIHPRLPRLAVGVGHDRLLAVQHHPDPQRLERRLQCSTPGKPLTRDWPNGGFSFAASSAHPGGVNAAMADGSVRLHQELDRPEHLVGPRHPQRRRGDQRRSY